MDKNYRQSLIYYYADAIKAGLTYDEAETVRRAAMTLHRWSEHECNGTIERDETTGKTYSVWNIDGPGPIRRSPCPDRETPAIKRIDAIAKKYGLAWEHQGDPRGWPVHFLDSEGRRSFSPPVRG
jgi:hypothetical protein